MFWFCFKKLQPQLRTSVAERQMVPSKGTRGLVFTTWEVSDMTCSAFKCCEKMLLGVGNMNGRIFLVLIILHLFSRNVELPRHVELQTRNSIWLKLQYVKLTLTEKCTFTPSTIFENFWNLLTSELTNHIVMKTRSRFFSYGLVSWTRPHLKWPKVSNSLVNVENLAA